MKNEQFITVLTFTFAYEVAIIRGRLESEGITCFVKDELTAQVHPFMSNAIGGVKLQVKESDLPHAIEILKETGYIKEQDLQVTPAASRLQKNVTEQDISAKERIIICPHCGSEEVVKSKKAGLFFLLTSFLFTFPTPFLYSYYYCFDCKQEFKRK